MNIETSDGAWPEYRRAILSFLGLSPVEDTDISWLPDGAVGGG